jgi:uncharacterized protein YegL
MLENATLEGIEFLDQQPRCACVLLLDTSSSMLGASIDALNAGLNTFRDELAKDDLAKRRVEVAIIEFNSGVNVVQDFVQAEDFQPPLLSARGSTAMGAGIERAIDIVHARKEKYKHNGVTYYRPWIFMITDGAPTDSVTQATTRLKAGEEGKKFSFFAVGVQGADVNALSRISAREPKMLDGLNFSELFVWLSASMQRVSQSRPGEMVPMEKPTWEAIA